MMPSGGYWPANIHTAFCKRSDAGLHQQKQFTRQLPFPGELSVCRSFSKACRVMGQRSLPRSAEVNTVCALFDDDNQNGSEKHVEENTVAVSPNPRTLSGDIAQRMSGCILIQPLMSYASSAPSAFSFARSSSDGASFTV